MAYADLLEEESATRQYLAIIKPRRENSTSWTLDSGAIYKQTFDYGQVINVTETGVELTEAASSSLASGEWFYDEDTEELYVRTSGDVDPGTTLIISTYEIYVATFDAHFRRVPNDSSSREVYYEPLIEGSPAISSTTKDVLFGFLPNVAGSIQLINAEHIFERHIYDSSWNKAEIDVYQWIDELIPTNVKLVYRGRTSSIRYRNFRLTIRTFGQGIDLDDEFRHDENESFYSTGDFADLDPDFVGRPIRKVYGRVGGLAPVNIDYVVDSPTTSDNRDWVVMHAEGTSEKTFTVDSGAHTTLLTFVTDATGIFPGDRLRMNNGVPEYAEVLSVDYGTGQVDHTVIGTPMTASETLNMLQVSSVDVIQENTIYKCFPYRDYTIQTALGGGTMGFSFTSSMESNVSLPNTLRTTDKVRCSVYGDENDVTLSSSPFGSDDTKLGVQAHPIVTLYDLLKAHLKIPEQDMNLTSFTSLESSIDTRIGLAIPREVSDDFPTYKELFLLLAETELLRLFIDDDQKWKLTQIGALGSEDKTIEEDEILRGSINYEFNYDEIINPVRLEYNFREISDQESKVTSDVDVVTASDQTAEFLHLVSKQKTFQSLHLEAADAGTLASRIGFILSDRAGRLSITTKSRFFDTELNDVIKVKLTKLPGFAFDEDTVRERDFAVIESNKTLDEITLVLDDQKGVEDNSGSF